MSVTYLFVFQWEKPQIKESKKAFFYATITDGGDKEKLECFVDFCEDAIFEMQVGNCTTIFTTRELPGDALVNISNE